MSLQDTFYLVGIIYMSLMIIFVVALLALLLVIKSKIDKIQAAIDQKLKQVQKYKSQLFGLFGVFRSFMRR